MEIKIQLQEQLKLLDELQNIDLEYLKIEQEQLEIPKQIDEWKSKMTQLDEEMALKEAHYNEIVKKRRSMEKELAIQEEKIGRENEKLMSVKTNKEYHAIQKEIQTMKNSIGDTEDQLLRLMEEIEDFEREFKRMKERNEKTKNEMLEHITMLQKHLDEIPVRLESVKSDRAEHSSKIDTELMESYIDLRRKRQGLAVVKVENGVCFGCRLRLPPQLFNLIQRNESIMKCPNCHRILYWIGTPKVHNTEENGSLF